MRVDYSTDRLLFPVPIDFLLPVAPDLRSGQPVALATRIHPEDRLPTAPYTPYGIPVMELVRERRGEDRGRRYKDRKK